MQWHGGGGDEKTGGRTQSSAQHPEFWEDSAFINDTPQLQNGDELTQNTEYGLLGLFRSGGLTKFGRCGRSVAMGIDCFV